MTTQDLLLMFAVFFILATYGIWKYSRAEDSDYRKFVEKASELNVRMSTLERQCITEKNQAWMDTLMNVNKLTIEYVSLSREMNEIQDHCAKLRKSQIDLRDRSYPRTVEVTFPVTGAVPVEIRGPTKVRPKIPTPVQAKKLLKKTRQQIRELSK